MQSMANPSSTRIRPALRASTTDEATGNGVANPTFIHAMSPTFWHMQHRFKLLGEADGGGCLHAGGFGKVFRGFDHLTQQMVFVKRQSTSANAGKESSCFRMLQAFPHPNIVKMVGMWSASFNGREEFYIAMEACQTTLWKYIRVANSDAQRQFRERPRPQHLAIGVVRAVGHLHGLGVIHGDVSLSNILLTATYEVKLADFGVSG